MSLRAKLLLIALSTLTLPLAGWLFVRQMEELLRQGQEQTLIASAQALARSLAALNTQLPSAGDALYVHRLATQISVDGYSSDWAALTPYAQSLGPAGDANKLTLLLGADTSGFYLLANVHDATRSRADADNPQIRFSDHLVLTLARGMLSRRYLLASSAPGRFDALTLPDRANTLEHFDSLLLAATSNNDLPVTLSGAWQEDGSGYRVELRLPPSQMPDQLAVGVYDADMPAQSTLGAQPLPLLRLSPDLSAQLAQFAPTDMRARLLNDQGWVIAESGSVASPNPMGDGRHHWLENLVYRSLLAPALTSADDFSPALPRLGSMQIWQALSGVTASAWRPAASGDGVVLCAAVPLKVRGEVRGALLLEHAGDALPLLTNRALLGLAAASLFALLVAGGIAFAFASVLSVRIRRLRNAAERALRSSGKSDTPLPLTRSRDELGDLARSFSHLLDEVGAYTDYLRTLASKLSHELHTPLAIVKSSLDNLDTQNLPADAHPYVARARDGAERLGSIVRAMSQASRMEHAIAAAECEDFDLVAVARGCADSYRSLLAPRRLDVVLPDSPLLVHGAPELIAQALDKLVDNARSFTPVDGWLRIEVLRRADGADLAVANSGPLLPPTMQDRLFDSLVSLRGGEKKAGAAAGTPHLGLGLYLVRLIAQAYRGNAVARNLDDGTGVEFRLVLRGMPRQRLGG
ncbi:MAG TPA: ATP-binding protein [Rudaea sp.]|nr:ATP-binding protein [Rudaea sp.]